jgi:lipase
MGSYELGWRRAGTGGPVLLLHGITDSSACWGRVMEDLSGDFDMVATDARGHGRSSRWPVGMTNAGLADDAATVIREVFGGPVAVWGHSMGAATATLLAARHPDLVTAVVLEDPPYAMAVPSVPGIPPEMVTGIGQMVQALRKAPEADRLAVAAAMNPLWHPSELPGWVESKLDFDESVLAGDVIDWDWRTPMARVTAPVLLVVGEPALGGAVDDQTASALVATHPDTQALRLPVGHNVHREAYGEVLAAVREFLADRG